MDAKHNDDLLVDASVVAIAILVQVLGVTEPDVELADELVVAIVTFCNFLVMASDAS